MNEFELQEMPALSVIIFEEESVIYQNFLGKSNIEQDISLEYNHLFLVASVSKIVTATALLQLFDDGFFNLDDSINDFLPYNISSPNYSTPITFRMLLTHTSGINDGNSGNEEDYFYGEDSSVELSDFLASYLTENGENYNASDQFYDFEPGTNYEYSNLGSALIGVLVEEISNQNFNEYCKEHIFSPLNMNNTYWSLEEALANNETIVQPYEYAGGFEAIEHYTFSDYPNGGLRTTATDFVKLLNAFVNNGNSYDYQLLKASTINEMVKPQISAINNEGFHLFLENANRDIWGHSGGEQGVSTLVGFNTETKVGAIIFTNIEDADLSEILVEAYKLGLTL